jgi:hypothetical protein
LSFEDSVPFIGADVPGGVCEARSTIEPVVEGPNVPQVAATELERRHDSRDVLVERVRAKATILGSFGAGQ